jgi:hypothetical protein
VHSTGSIAHELKKNPNTKNRKVKRNTCIKRI